MRLKDKHLKIISALQTNARVQLSAIASTLDMPVSSVFDAYYCLAGKGMFTRHVSVLDFEALGYFQRSIVFLKEVVPDDAIGLLVRHYSMNNIYLLDGGILLAEFILRDRQRLQELLLYLSESGFSVLQSLEVGSVIKFEEAKIGKKVC